MPRFSPPVAAALLATSLAVAQASYPVGFHDVAWLNAYGIGSPVIGARISYPAVSSGQDTSVAPSPAGWPVVVFLHGYGQIGSDYQLLASAWAERGFAVVALETGQFDFVTQRDDATAVFDAVVTATAESGSLLAGAFDVQNMLIAGHSMGGGVTALVLADNPGYRAGFALSPFDPTIVTGPFANQVVVPFGIVVGEGDLVTPPALHADPLYQALGVPKGVKFLQRLDSTVDHLDLAGLSGGAGDPAFVAAVRVSTGFFAHALHVRGDGLEECLGVNGQAEPLLVSMTQQVGLPETWHAHPLQIGATMRFSGAFEPGLGVLVAAPALLPAIPTPFGDLLVDPFQVAVVAIGVVGAERRLDLTMQLPNDPLLVGLDMAVQSFGTTVTQPLWFGSALRLTVQP